MASPPKMIQQLRSCRQRTMLFYLLVGAPGEHVGDGRLGHVELCGQVHLTYFSVLPNVPNLRDGQPRQRAYGFGF